MDTSEIKREIRKKISTIKREYTLEWRCENSAPIVAQLELLPAFEHSSTILLYHALPDEVQTQAFLDKWWQTKRLVLPVVDGDNLLLRRYSPDKVEVGYCSIMEPTDAEEILAEEIELAIIPGVAFDAQRNRLGRGRGFYDRLLPSLGCDIVGIGFDYQIVEVVPMEPFDQKLSLVITETRIF